jgi:hypothetical protein
MAGESNGEWKSQLWAEDRKGNPNYPRAEQSKVIFFFLKHREPHTPRSNVLVPPPQQRIEEKILKRKEARK